MKTNHLIALAVAAAIAVGGAVAVSLSGSSGSGSQKTAKLFPSLAAQINDVGTVIVARKDETVTLAKKDNGWVVAEKYNYPASFEKVRNLLVDLAELQPLEQKTSTAALYPELQLEDLSQADAKSVLLTIKSANGQELLAT